MKKTLLLMMALLLLAGLAACGQEKAPAPDMEERYAAIQKTEGAPDMVVVPPKKCAALYGIDPEDCAQQLVAICQNSLLADEYWLIEAVDADAADRIEALARTRLEQKEAELRNYAPEQYEVVRQARLLRQDCCVILLVSPRAEALADLFA